MRRGRNNIFGAVETRCVRPCVTRVIGSQLDFKGCRSPSSAPTLPRERKREKERANERESSRIGSLVRLLLPSNEDRHTRRKRTLERDADKRRRGGYVKITRAMRETRVRERRRVLADPLVGMIRVGRGERERVGGNTHAPEPLVRRG